MNLGIYKPGQGYWVRVMSAVLAALLTVSLAAWGYGQMQILADRLPKTTYRVGIETEQPGMFNAGDTVQLLTRPDSTGASVSVGTATVAAGDATEKKILILRDYKPEAAFTASNAGIIRKSTPDAAPVNIAKGAVAGIAAIEPALLGGGAAVAVIIIGASLGYWLVGLRPRTVEFLIATDFEMKKVNWSTPREIMGHTWVVIGACVLLATTLFLVDSALKVAFTAIGLLPK